MLHHVKFIHAADLHLDSPFKGLGHLPAVHFQKIRESTFYAFDRMIDLAIQEKVDFLLLAGDLYDEEDRSLKAQLRLRRQFERLNHSGIHVYIIHGNHDHTGGSRVQMDWPPNVHIFSDREVECIPFVREGEVLANLYGYSYPARAVTENIAAKFRKKEDAPFHIGLLHGSVSQVQVPEHEPYCPFSIQQLLEKDFDYWALGHIHKQQILNREHPPIIYPGNIQGRHKKESGEKGVYLVNLFSQGECQYRFVPLCDILWDEIRLSVNELDSVSDLVGNIQQLKELQREKKSALWTIVLEGISPLFWDLSEQQTIEELMQLLNEEEEEKNNFVWIVSIQTEIFPDSGFLDTGYFSKEWAQIMEQNGQFDKAVEPLNANRLFRRFLQSWTDQEKEEIRKEAQTMVYYELMKQGWGKMQG